MVEEPYLRCRPRLLGVAYGILGDLGEAEDVVQDAWLRLDAAGSETVASLDAFLVTVTTRLAIDRLRSARSRREHYVGPWLPEPLLVDEADPESVAMRAADLSLALLSALERLNPVERAVLVLRDVFDFEYAEIADIVNKTPANCRQLAKRAREHAGEPARRSRCSHEHADALLTAFTTAIRSGDLDGLQSLLAADAILYTDGGGEAAAARKPIYGAAKVARFFAGVRRKGYFGPELGYAAVSVNGEPGLRIDASDRPVALIALEPAGGTIAGIRLVNNPRKLARLYGHTARLFERFAARARLGPEPDLADVVEAIRAMPYRRPKDRTPAGVVEEWAGTCSTKHALLRQLVHERFPRFTCRLVHRVYRVTPELARARFGPVAAAAVPPEGLLDVHTYATIERHGRPAVVDVTFPGGPRWDGCSDMPLACGEGTDYDAGEDPLSTKAALVSSYCDAAVREPFIAELGRPVYL